MPLMTLANYRRGPTALAVLIQMSPHLTMSNQLAQLLLEIIQRHNLHGPLLFYKFAPGQKPHRGLQYFTSKVSHKSTLAELPIVLQALHVRLRIKMAKSARHGNNKIIVIMHQKFLALWESRMCCNCC